jgi:hypothetical protein
MNNDKFHAKILQVKSYVDEFGKLFEQEILVESRKGEIFWIFDVSLLCDKQMEGQMAILEFNVWQNASDQNISKLENREKKILLPKTPLGRKSPEHYPIFYGEIVEQKHEISSNRQFTLDVGSGIITIRVYETEYNKYSVGDYIKVDGNIVQLSEIDGRET